MSKGSRIPKYQQIFQDLKSDIQTKYAVGDILPPEPELEKIYNASRTTIRTAVQLLVDEGWVTVRQGQGTRVANRSTVQRLNYITSLSETLREAGYKVSYNNVCASYIIPNSNITKSLELEEGDAVVQLQRLISANDKPIAIVTNYIIPQYGTALIDNLESVKSLYGFLEKCNGIRLENATDYVTARLANFMQSNILKLPINSPLLYTRRVTYHNGKPITYDEVYVDASRYQISFNMVGRPPV